MSPARTRYSRLQIALHWLVALLILAAWWFSDGMGRVLADRLRSGDTGFTGNTLHVWLGSAVFALILIRIGVRLVSGAPAALTGTPPLLEKLGLWGHRLLYLLMVLVPASGAATWYAGVRAAGDVHETTSNLLMIVALGHAAAALYHHYVVKDATLRRMLRTGAPE
jgi:cytochrome b561